MLAQCSTYSFYKARTFLQAAFRLTYTLGTETHADIALVYQLMETEWTRIVCGLNFTIEA